MAKGRLYSVRQMILGTMLGDGCLSCYGLNPIYRSRHGWVQHSYNVLKSRVLRRYVDRPPKKLKNGGYGKYSSHFQTRTTAKLAEYREICMRPVPGKTYSNGRTKYSKHVTRLWLDQITWEGIAWWIADDGSLQGSPQSPRMTFHTQGFTKAEVKLIQHWLREKGIRSTLHWHLSRTTGKPLWYLCCTVKSTLKLLRKTRPFAPSTMVYKWEYSRATTATCAYCHQEFTLLGSQTRDPGKLARMRACCQQPDCLRDRHRELNEAYREKNRERLNKKSSERYYRGGEKLRAYYREKAYEWKEKNRERYLANRRRWRAERKSQQPPKDLVCKICLQTFTVVGRAGNFCSEECKQIARNAARSKYEAKLRDSQKSAAAAELRVVS